MKMKQSANQNKILRFTLQFVQYLINPKEDNLF